jgi:hypothetical protein
MKLRLCLTLFLVQLCDRRHLMVIHLLHQWILTNEKWSLPARLI